MTRKITMLKLLVEFTDYDDEGRVAIPRTASELVVAEAQIPESMLTFITERLKANG